MLVMVVFFIAFRWIHLSTPLIRLFLLVLILLFLFQGEDGIRCVAVTGVQTCALPIFRRAAIRPAHSAAPAQWPRAGASRGKTSVPATCDARKAQLLRAAHRLVLPDRRFPATARRAAGSLPRSARRKPSWHAPQSRFAKRNPSSRRWGRENSAILKKRAPAARQCAGGSSCQNHFFPQTPRARRGEPPNSPAAGRKGFRSVFRCLQSGFL